MNAAVAVPVGRILRVEDYGFAVESKPILRGVSFHVDRGEYVTIVGPNGAGKSTLLKCLMRILRGGSGRIELAGRTLESYTQRELARRLGYVPQADGRTAPFTVEQFVLLSRYPYLNPFAPASRADRRAVQAALEATDTAELAGRQMGSLSGGERQRVFIAAALAQEADMLLLDEPATFLDYRHQAAIRGVLVRANRQQGVAILAVTHDVSAAALESDRILGLCAGSIVFSGTPEELMRAEVLRRIYQTEFLLVPHPQVQLPVVVPPAMERFGSAHDARRKNGKQTR